VATRVNEEEKKIKAVKTGSEEDFVNWNSCYAWISINNMHGGYSYQILSSNWNWKISRVLWMADIRILIDRFLISKETVVLRRWERSKQKFGCIKQVDKDWTTTVEDSESWRLERQPPKPATVAVQPISIDIVWRGELKGKRCRIPRCFQHRKPA